MAKIVTPTAEKKGETMQVQREFKTDIARSLETIPIEQLEKILKNGILQKEEPKKWKKIAQEFVDLGISKETSEYILKTIKELRGR